jgi:hypothetical protein
MSCYLRHLREILEEAGVGLKGKAGRRVADKAIYDLVGVEYKDLPKYMEACETAHDRGGV